MDFKKENQSSGFTQPRILSKNKTVAKTAGRFASSLNFNDAQKSGDGFTLIELLIVIAIIGLLATVILLALSSARVKARDAKRQADMHQLANALELYYQDHGSYPPNAVLYQSCFWDPKYSGYYSPNCLIELVNEGYMKSLPNTLLSSNYAYGYYNYGTGNALGAVIKVYMEKTKGLTQCDFPMGYWCDAADPYNYCMCFPN